MYTTKPPTSAQTPIATFLSNLASIAWTLNLRGSDVSFNPVFQAYLFIALDRAVLFIDSAKVSPEISEYLQSIGVTTREYSEVWPFLRGRDWGEGKVWSFESLRLATPHTLAPTGSLPRRHPLHGTSQPYVASVHYIPLVRGGKKGDKKCGRGGRI
jgi:Creatinase/Prolidase N-terminal domain